MIIQMMKKQAEMDAEAAEEIKNKKLEQEAEEKSKEDENKL